MPWYFFLTTRDLGSIKVHQQALLVSILKHIDYYLRSNVSLTQKKNLKKKEGLTFFKMEKRVIKETPVEKEVEIKIPEIPKKAEDKKSEDWEPKETPY